MRPIITIRKGPALEGVILLMLFQSIRQKIWRKGGLKNVAEKVQVSAGSPGWRTQPLSKGVSEISGSRTYKGYTVYSTLPLSPTSAHLFLPLHLLLFYFLQRHSLPKMWLHRLVDHLALWTFTKLYLILSPQKNARNPGLGLRTPIYIKVLL